MNDKHPGVEKSKQVASILAANDLYFFARYTIAATRGIRWQRAPHHKVIFDALTDVFEGRTKRLILNLPPRYSKTHSVFAFVTWALGKAPDSEFIFVSYSDRLATTNSWQARELVKHEVYNRIFPTVVLDEQAGARDEWRTTAGGCVYACGTGGSLTGRGAGKMREGFHGCVIADDLHKADEARSDVMRKGVLEWFQSTLQSRVNSPETPIIIVGQRLAEDDICGWLLNGGNGEKWTHVNMPAIREDGTALWPEKHTIEDLRRMEQASPYHFASQYMQRPAPLEGGIFKPGSLVVVDGAGETNAEPIQWVRAWDLASTASGGDWTVGAKLGRRKNGRIVIGDIQRLQGRPDEVEARIVSTAALDGKKVKISLPKDPGQAGVAQVAYLTRALMGFNVTSSPESGDKVTRAEPFASQVNVGNVDMVRGEWNLALVNEMRNFPFGKHDDCIDACSRAFNELSAARMPMVISDDALHLASIPRTGPAMGERAWAMQQRAVAPSLWGPSVPRYMRGRA